MLTHSHRHNMHKGGDKVFEDISDNRVPIHGYVDPVSGEISLACPDMEARMIQENGICEKITESPEFSANSQGEHIASNPEGENVSSVPKVESDSTWEGLKEDDPWEVTFNKFLMFTDDKSEVDIEPVYSYDDPTHMLTKAVGNLKLEGLTDENVDPWLKENSKDNELTSGMTR